MKRRGQKEGQREKERERRERVDGERTDRDEDGRIDGNKDEGSEPPRSACCIGREVHRSLEIIIIAADNECCRRQFDIRRR